MRELELARAADLCAGAARAGDRARFGVLARESGCQAELLELWARLLVTVVPEDSAAVLVETLWRQDDSVWLIGIEHFLDYAHRRDPACLSRFVGEVGAWPWPERAAFTLALVSAIADLLPPGIRPSHYLVARGLVAECGEPAGIADLTGPVAGLVAFGWREEGFCAVRLGFDLSRHVERELPGRGSRRAAAVVLATVLGRAEADDERGVDGFRRGARLLNDTDDPRVEADEVENATLLAARAVRFASAGQFARLRAELDRCAGPELLAVVVALAFAVASHVREQPEVSLP
ncbi:hypothetical protein FPZ12_040610 [Amycolatopsis acidicola]|uniref:Uncharacterized protein n=1 Tax=Amycolatopsis acidicola TaxID=2596893 RepID=A0A5N0UQU2_9PSEU|nr:hypothetical protein [Amycolatopsis acidicola]KAA9150728.1 hypothetical protein FPZ12_040610 [Amycolatopsis acidicola]